MPRVVLALAVLVLTVYALADALQADRNRVRLMPWWLWLVAVIVAPVVGPLCWLFLGRPTPPGVGGSGRRPLGPDDDPDFLRKL